VDFLIAQVAVVGSLLLPSPARSPHAAQHSTSAANARRGKARSTLGHDYMGFTKLFSDIILSSVWSEDDKTRLVWISLLAITNADGFVSGSVPGLATAARVSMEDCEKALKKLASPDPHSRTKDHEGRRIEVVDGGWLILNYRLYRDRVSDDPNAVKVRERVRRHRERQRTSPLSDSHPGTTTEAEDRSRSSVTLRNVTPKEKPLRQAWQIEKDIKRVDAALSDINQRAGCFSSQDVLPRLQKRASEGDEAAKKDADDWQRLTERLAALKSEWKAAL